MLTIPVSEENNTNRKMPSINSVNRIYPINTNNLAESTYLKTEAGDQLITEEGDNLIL